MAERLSGRVWVFAVVMLAATALFVVLGTWQLQRLGEKEALAATVAARLGDAPVALPPATAWASLDVGAFDYRPVRLAGSYVPDRTVLVFTSLPAGQGSFGGPGYWVMTPLALEDGGTVFVNRGFVPQEMAADRAGLEPENAGEPTEVAGVARRAELAGSFTPASDGPNRIDWVRDPERLAALAEVEAPVAPLYVDLPAGPPGELPQGGGTVVSFSNNHLGYALTWFGFAILTPILLAFWVRRQRRPTRS